MHHSLRGYQEQAVASACEWAESASPGDKRLYAAPTGTGKSLIELAVQDRLPGFWWIVTPRVEIIRGMMNKLGENADDWSEGVLLRRALDQCITTPIRLRNAMMAGELGYDIDGLILDEAHHSPADTWEQVSLLSGTVPMLGYTATPFRGTPKGTAAFRTAWGEPEWILTYPDAMRSGFLSMPRCTIIPLVDDDEITISNGEFQVSQVRKAVSSKIADVVDRAVAWRDRPTMFAVPDTETAKLLADLLTTAGHPTWCVTQSTSSAMRVRAFADCVANVAFLVQINVVSEGVDLPIRRLVDLTPMISPVRWLQQFGRITRPVGYAEAAPEYIGTNRNLLRHAYLLEGCIPPFVVGAAAQQFGGLGKRPAIRVLGLEGTGRLRAAEFPLADGSIGFCYNVSTVQDTLVREYCVIARPEGSPIWATRTRTKAVDRIATYGRWERCEPPRDGLTGYASVPPSPLSDKQAAWWAAAAGRYGLDATAKVTRKVFPVLPVLRDIRMKL